MRREWVRWSLLLIIPCLFGLLVFQGVRVWVAGQPNEYSTRATLAFNPIPNKDGIFPSAETAAVAANKYVAYVTSPGTVSRVAGAVGEDPTELSEGLSATIAPGTSNLVVQVTLATGPRAARAANALAAFVASESRDDEVVSTQLVAPATAPDSPTGPPRGLLVGIGAVLALMVAGILAAAGWFGQRALGLSGGDRRNAPTGEQAPLDVEAIVANALAVTPATDGSRAAEVKHVPEPLRRDQ